jgi:ribosomal protein S18 acetylase RimI-like enzyme
VADEAVPEKLKREKAGTYRTADGRFTVEQTSSGWLLLDSEETNELGLPLTRGPFSTLDAARDAIRPARSGPAPKGEILSIAGRKASNTATLTKRSTARGTGVGDRKDVGQAEVSSEAGDRAGNRPRRGAQSKPRPKRPATPAVVFRDLRAADGDQLRKLWATCGFRALGDDDLSLARMARRNPGLLLVASEGTRVVASALGAWDGRRGWIYHVATAETHRRQGIASKLVGQVEAGLRDLGCPKVSVLVRDENEDARGFWRARGYDQASRQFARELQRD